MRVPTAIETFLFAAFAAAVAFLVVPDFLRAREGYAVELAARAASACDAELDRLARADPDGEPSLARISESLASRDAPALVWPREADLSTIDFSSTNGVSVLLRFRGGARRVDARDLDVDHAN